VDTLLRVYNHPGRSLNTAQATHLPPECNAEAVKLVTEQGYSVAEAGIAANWPVRTKRPGFLQ
jgi:hypothetical protein